MKQLFETAPGARVLAIGAHPDDIEIGTGGLVARLARHGAQVVMAVVSVPNHTEERLAEAARGAQILGAQLRVIFAGELCRVEDVPMYTLVSRLDELIAEKTPDLVITHSAHDLHWDHRLVHHATVSALRRTACDLIAFTSSPEMSAQPRSTGECFADIGETIEKKLQAIGAHGTQLPKLDLESTRDRARALGRISGVQYAESFEVLRIRI